MLAAVSQIVAGGNLYSTESPESAERLSHRLIERLRKEKEVFDNGSQWEAKLQPLRPCKRCRVGY